MTEKAAASISICGWWRGLDAVDILSFQLFEERLCMPFTLYQQCVSEVLGRPVLTHELGTSGWDEMKTEFLARYAPEMHK